MAAANSPTPVDPPREGLPCLDPSGLRARLEEEISRAVRQSTALSCLLVRIEGDPALGGDGGRRLQEQALAYVAAALAKQLRRFDRIGHDRPNELVVVLPGADGRRGEIVARRALGRMRAVKLEVGGERRSLRVAVGIGAWTQGVNAEELLARARLAALMGRGEQSQS
jgi:GGDEF domain-containing protein